MIYELFECLISWSNWCSTMIGFLSCFLPQNSHSKSTLPAGFKFSLLGPSKLMIRAPLRSQVHHTLAFWIGKEGPCMGPIGEDSRMVKWDPFSPAAAIFGAPLKTGMFFFLWGGGGAGDVVEFLFVFIWVYHFFDFWFWWFYIHFLLCIWQHLDACLVNGIHRTE